jgi:hypothetical protein
MNSSQNVYEVRANFAHRAGNRPDYFDASIWESCLAYSEHPVQPKTAPGNSGGTKSSTRLVRVALLVLLGCPGSSIPFSSLLARDCGDAPSTNCVNQFENLRLVAVAGWRP